jgi:hypothetical protein
MHITPLRDKYFLWLTRMGVAQVQYRAFELGPEFRATFGDTQKTPFIFAT